jgi:hypothetical protein
VEDVLKWLTSNDWRKSEMRYLPGTEPFSELLKFRIEDISIWMKQQYSEIMRFKKNAAFIVFLFGLFIGFILQRILKKKIKTE